MPTGIALATALLCILIAVLGLVLARRGVDADERRTGHTQRVLMLAAAAGVGSLTFIGWWASAAHTPLWVRHPASGVLAFFPVIVIVALWGVRVLYTRGAAARVLAVAATALLCASLTWSVAGHLAQTTQPRGETLATQRADVAPIREWVDQTGTEWIAAHPWGAAVAPIVLSGAHVGLWDAPAMADVPRLTGLPCDTEVIVEGGRYRVCAAPAG